MTVQRSLRGLILIHIAMGFAFASAQDTQVIPTTSETPTNMTQPTPTKPSSGKFGNICLNNTTLKTR
jgi:hypothetical protein